MTDDSWSQLSKMNLTRLDTFTNSLQETQEAGRFIEDMLKANQVAASQDKLQSEAEDNSAMGIQIRTRKLEKKKDIKTEKAKQVQESILVRKEDADGLADGFSQRQGNREYRMDPRLLSQLAEDIGIGIHENANPDELISLVRRHMTIHGQSPDVAIVDKALEFLLEVARNQLTSAKGPAKERLESIYKKLETAKFKHFENNAVAIQVAQKIIGAVDAVVEKTGQTVKETLDRYRDVVHNPPDLQTLRKFYESKGYRAMVLELKGLNTYLGGNFKRANLESPELAQLANAARKMQALLGVFRQSKIHLPTMESYLTLNGVMGEFIEQFAREVKIGEALVKTILKSSQAGIIADCQVIEGLIQRNNQIRLIRDEEIIWEGRIDSLRRVKEEVREVKVGSECEILLHNFSNILEGDIIEAYEVA